MLAAELARPDAHEDRPMSNRREFLLGSLAGGGALALAAAGAARAESGAVAGSSGTARGPAPPYRLIIDGRFEVTRGLADAARAHGVATRIIAGDVTDVWFNELALRWRAGPAPIAGLTTVGALFCLERLAWDAGMRLQWRADHRLYRDGRVEHALQAPDTLLTRSDVRALARPDWARGLLPLLSGAGARPAGALTERVISGAPGSFPAGHSEWLVSWYIGARPARQA
jgi:hypothetical protein